MSFKKQLKVGLFLALISVVQSAIAVNVSSFTPGFGGPGEIVIIQGSGFVPNNIIVTFGGVRDFTAGVTAADGTIIQAMVPAGAVTGPISVKVGSELASSVQDFIVIGPGPYVSGFSPFVGSGGTTVTISGSHFGSGSGWQVTFDGKAGTGLFIRSETELQVNAPSGVTSGPIKVSNSLGSYTTISNFFVPPTLIGFSPTNGRTGTNVVITGTNLRGTMDVQFNGVSATSISNLSNGALSVTVPLMATTGKIRVNAPAGSATSSGIFIVPPTIYSFGPTFGPVGSTVVLTGANFNVGTPKVFFNGVQAANGAVSFGTMTNTVPAGATTGPISITTSNGTHTTLTLFYLPPVITGFSPSNSPAGSIIKISGTNFIDASAVSFNGSPALAFWVTNNNTIGAVIPAGLATGPISVTTPAGTATSSGRFYGPLGITGFTPTSGLPGTNVTVFGSNFLGVNFVLFGEVPAVFTATNNTFLTAIVPPGAETGPITVGGPGGTNVSTANFVLNYTSDVELQASDSPDPVNVGSTLVYTLIVTNRGPFSAPNFRVTNLLDESVTLKGVSISQGSWTNFNGDITVNFGTLAANQWATLLISVIPNSPGTITNRTDIASDYPDPVTANNAAILTTTVLPLPILHIQLSATNRVRLSWPAALSNYTLQFRPSLDPGVFWSNVVRTPTVVGSERVLTESTSNSASFYRLKQ